MTQILKLAGLIDTTWLSEYGRDRGSAVHKACELDDYGTLDEATIDPAVAPYLAAYRKFKAEMRPAWTDIEGEMEGVGYAGRYDRKGTLGDDPREWIVDIKTGAPVPATALQLAGYANGQRVRRGALHLSPDGRYRLIEYTDRNDWRVFLAAQTIAVWRVQHALAEREDAA